MALRWHLDALLTARSLAREDLAARLSFPLPQESPPSRLTLAELGELCSVLGCQPAELLTDEPETPAEQAARELSNNLSYQSFLTYRDDP